MIDERDKQIKELIHIIEGLEGDLANSETKNKDIIEELSNVKRQNELQDEELEKTNSEIRKLALENETLRNDLTFSTED